MRQRVNSDLSGGALPGLDAKFTSYSPSEEQHDESTSQFSSNASFSNLMTSIRTSLTSLPVPLEASIEDPNVSSPLFLTEADIHTYLRLDRVSILFHYPIQRLLGMFEALYWSDFFPNVVHTVNLYLTSDAILVAGTSEVSSFPMQLILPFTEIAGVSKNISMPSLLAHVYAIFSVTYQLSLRTTSGSLHSFSAYSQTDALYDLVMTALKSVTLPDPLLRTKSEGAGIVLPSTKITTTTTTTYTSSSSSSSSISSTFSISDGLASFDIHSVPLNTTFHLGNNASLPRWQSAYPNLLSWFPCLPLDETLLVFMYQGPSKNLASPDDPGWDPSDSPITLGIPDAYRCKLWPLFARALFVKRTHPYSYYISLGGHPRFRDEIEKDIGRSLPEHPAFQSPVGCQALRRVLNAFAQKNPRIGYAQAMNLIASLLLLSVPEEDAFWILCHIVEGILPDHYSKTLIGSVTDQKVFERLLEQHQPKLAKHLKGLQVELSTLTISWFVALFLSTLPFRLGQVVLDFFLLRKEVFLFQLSLAIFQMNSPLLLEAQDEFQVMDIMKRYFFQFQGQEDENEDSSSEYAAGTNLESREDLVKDVNRENRGVKENSMVKKKDHENPSLDTSSMMVVSPRPSQSASYLFRSLLVTAFQRYGQLRSADVEKLRLECRFATTHRMEDDFRLSQLRTLKEATLFQEHELNRFYTEYQWILLTFNQPISGLNIFGFRIFFQVVVMTLDSESAVESTAMTPSSQVPPSNLPTPISPISLTNSPLSPKVMSNPTTRHLPSSSFITSGFLKAWPFTVTHLTSLPDLMFQDACNQFHVSTLTLPSCVAQLQSFLKDSVHSRLRLLFRLHDVNQTQQLNAIEFYALLFNLTWLLGGNEWDWLSLKQGFKALKNQQKREGNTKLKHNENLSFSNTPPHNDITDEKKGTHLEKARKKSSLSITTQLHSSDINEVEVDHVHRPMTEVVTALLTLCDTIKENGLGNAWLETLDFHSYPVQSLVSSHIHTFSPSFSSTPPVSSIEGSTIPFHSFLMAVMSHPYLVKKLKL
ncbi:TBC1 domain member 9 [Coelomomyces lativittatus]|nr:TBC1 domain member 9 [Coelomomyces lativittatus]KAJ1513681.1 TBC1 domain member 9 [Coelomomyces lativittatus]